MENTSPRPQAPCRAAAPTLHPPPSLWLLRVTGTSWKTPSSPHELLLGRSPRPRSLVTAGQETPIKASAPQSAPPEWGGCRDGAEPCTQDGFRRPQHEVRVPSVGELGVLVLQHVCSEQLHLHCTPSAAVTCFACCGCEWSCSSSPPCSESRTMRLLPSKPPIFSSNSCPYELKTAFLASANSSQQAWEEHNQTHSCRCPKSLLLPH